ncbi:MAG: hypothetical protein LBF22_02720 [Deltaproteobacteria bacterium]|nr:hypothetical protein [Deltaproteobacteria bacterium]
MKLYDIIREIDDSYLTAKQKKWKAKIEAKTAKAIADIEAKARAVVAKDIADAEAKARADAAKDIADAIAKARADAAKARAELKEFQLTLARELLDKGTPINKIISMSKLTRKEVESIKKKLSSKDKN